MKQTPFGVSRHRLDIQGLRAIAVALVVLYHSRVAFTGGFLGVDVFFVISGFLITSLIVREIESTGKLSLVNFWMRRIRRILPASIVVIAATAGVVMWIGSPEQLESIGRHVFASAFSGENILLAFDQADYFRSAEAPSPLQHFWSLAVEEQFYIVWPVVVLLGGPSAEHDVSVVSGSAIAAASSAGVSPLGNSSGLRPSGAR
jgi:peptidoglycan/LPS O-acetylase OafA/YrhL